jgi:hypothetical protein
MRRRFGCKNIRSDQQVWLSWVRLVYHFSVRLYYPKLSSDWLGHRLTHSIDAINLGTSVLIYRLGDGSGCVWPHRCSLGYRCGLRNFWQNYVNVVYKGAEQRAYILQLLHLVLLILCWVELQSYVRAHKRAVLWVHLSTFIHMLLELVRQNFFRAVAFEW